jgi:iron complex transport system substrate-binding protein
MEMNKYAAKIKICNFIIKITFLSMIFLGLCFNQDALAKVKRIVSLTVGSDEIVYDLLEKSSELHRIAALSTLADNPSFSNISKKAKNIKNRAGAQIESVISLRPDLIIVAAYTNPSFLNKLNELKLNHIKLSRFSSLNDIKLNIRAIAKAIGSEKHADFLTSKLEQIKKIDGFSKKSVINFNKSGFIMGKDTIIDDLLSKSGLINAVTATGWPKISAENLISLNPDYIISTGQPEEIEAVQREISKRQGWSQMKALENAQIILIEQKHLAATSHYITEAYLSMVRQLRSLESKKNK